MRVDAGSHVVADAAVGVDFMVIGCIFCVEHLMNAKRSMTLNLTDAEMAALDELAQKKELSKTAIIRQAIR